MKLFVRLTLIVACAIAALFALVLVVKLLLVAAVVAALLAGGLFLARALGFRPALPRRWVTTLTARR